MTNIWHQLIIHHKTLKEILIMKALNIGQNSEQNHIHIYSTKLTIFDIVLHLVLNAFQQKKN